MTTAALVIGLCAVFVGAVLQRLSGTGVGLVVAPVFALLAGPHLGIFVTNTATIVSGLLIGLAVIREVDWKRYGIMASVGLLGSFPAARLVRDSDPAFLNTVIGAVVFIALVTTFSSSRLPKVTSSALTAAAGISASFLNTAAGVSAPAMVIYAKLTHWPQHSFAATMQPTFMTLAVFSVSTKLLVGVGGLGGLPPWWFFAAMVTAVLMGIAVGGRAARLVSPSAARTVAVALAGIGAAATFIRGILLF